MERREHDFMITENGFEPFEIKAPLGTEINFINIDNKIHSVKSDVDIFDSGDIAPEGMYTFVFDDPGTQNFHCHYHENERGRVIVE